MSYYRLCIWDSCDFERQCYSCYDAHRLPKTAVDGNGSSIYDCQGSSRETCARVYTRQWGSLSRSCPGVFLMLATEDTLLTSLVRHLVTLKLVLLTVGAFFLNKFLRGATKIR